MDAGRVFVGTAGWSIPKTSADRVGGDGTHLQRYARVLNGAEINSSFYRPHAASTYARWAASTPADFRFAVKVPREITHTRRLVDVEAVLARFLDESAGLGVKRGPLLVQLPPSLAFDDQLVDGFFAMLRASHDGPVACEPRHVSWTSDAAVDRLVQYRIARVAADPPRMEDDRRPGGWSGLVYYRWHGSPRVYWSPYDQDQLTTLAAATKALADDVEAWCIFDNTASGAALANALDLTEALRPDTEQPSERRPR
ncbi:MAG TPA: DUF72 domain-containing protein [Luteitalea sp.]|nr:DUF72 domain-containing protein [Luteitalea sp.]